MMSDFSTGYLEFQICQYKKVRNFYARFFETWFSHENYVCKRCQNGIFVMLRWIGPSTPTSFRVSGVPSIRFWPVQAKRVFVSECNLSFIIEFIITLCYGEESLCTKAHVILLPAQGWLSVTHKINLGGSSKTYGVLTSIVSNTSSGDMLYLLSFF